MSGNLATLDQLAEDVRQQDPDRFYAMLLAPARFRDPLLVLYALNLEIARTREQVSEPMLGQIRLQWWRDQLDGVFAGEPARHPVTEALSDVVSEFPIAREDIVRMIDGRERDLEDTPPDTTAELLDYCRNTSSVLMTMALQVLGVERGLAEKAAEPAGVAFALAGLIRAVPFHGAQGRVMLPRDLLASNGLDIAANNHHRDPQALRGVVRDLAGIAEDQLILARKQKRIPRKAMAGLLPATLAGLYIRRLRAADFDLSDARLDPPAQVRIFNMLRARLLGRI